MSLAVQDGPRDHQQRAFRQDHHARPAHVGRVHEERAAAVDVGLQALREWDGRPVLEVKGLPVDDVPRLVCHDDEVEVLRDEDIVPHVLLQVGRQGVVHVSVGVVPRGPVHEQPVHVLQLTVISPVGLPDLLQGIVLLQAVKAAHDDGVGKDELDKNEDSEYCYDDD